MSHNNNYNNNLQPFANKLRHNITKAEACLWKYALRANALGIPFRRERPIGRFIADFVTSIIKDKIEELKKIHPLPPPAGEIINFK